ncbi:FG-GAP-like repeat-containing protein [Streptomyces sp. NPDC020817]|uniref:FG-GAP-like repeat-containing protein n=1 Tax=Streptomyces sp. NPDC020817 TaxID=3365095 RepID=UPI0037B5EDE5
MRPPLARQRATGQLQLRASALVATLALTAGLTGTAPLAAAADSGPAAGASAPAAEAEKAAAEAKRTGKPVEIVGLRTETDEVWANPNGTRTAEHALVPIRVRQGGKLIPVDTTLHKGTDGRLAPKAASIGLTFSGGGDSPLAVMSENGRDVALSWPAPLPEPRLDGSSALYPEVLPGVDLRVSATVDSFSHALVVKSREAAANPALASLAFGLKAEGLTVRAEADGQLLAVDPAGQTVFGSAKPQMWDAGGQKAQAAAAQTAPAPAAKSPARSAAYGVAAAPAAGSAPAEAPPAPVEGVTTGARQADLGVRLNGSTLTLTPDQGLLKAPETTYPVVIDPTWDAWKTAWTIAYKHNAFPSSPNTNYWNGGTLSKDARVGCAKDAANGDAVICAKTFFQVGMKDYWDKQIIESTLRVKQKSAGSWSCKSGDIQVWDTGTISKSTTWNNQPDWQRLVDSSGQSYGGRNCPGDGDLIELNVKSAVEEAAKKHWGNWTFGLKAAKDTVDVSWRRLDPNSARISTTFNTTPDKITDRSTDPSTACTGGVVGTTDEIVLRARVKDKDKGDVSLGAEFHWWKDGSSSQTKSVIKASNGNVAQLHIPAKDLNGTYRWDVRTLDNVGPAGPWAGQCLFTIDRTRPDRTPVVTSKQFPENEDDPAKTGFARSEGTFTLSANGVKDVTGFEWWTDSNPKVNKIPPTTVGGSVDVKYTPTTAGPQRLFVRSLDASGNRSNLKEYLFYAKRLATRDKHGDLNGDGTVDIWSVDPGSGLLWMHPGKGDGTFDLSRQLDGQGSFADAASLTHRGSWNEDYYEDLVALQPSPDNSRKNLYVYPNKGDGDLESADANRIELQVGNPDLDDHWANADQAVAIGSVDDDNGDGRVDDSDQPDLLVKTGDQLWLYRGSAVGFLDAFGEPLLLGNADWKNMTLMAPGDLNGDRLPEVWARDTATGKIHQYTSRVTTEPGAVTVADLSVFADPAVRTTSIGSGFTGAAYAHLSSNGDFEANGFADLWSRDGNGRITEFPGQAPAGGTAFGAGRQLVLGGTSWSECQAFTSTATGTHTLCGPILAKYLAKGGTSIGYPTTDVLVPSDGVGRYVNLRGPGQTSDNGSVYWHPSSGAWIVWGGIRAKWLALGAEKGILGYPTSDETPTFDGTGRFSTFYSAAGGKGGIFWSTETGAWSVHGSIYATYVSLGGPASRIGYPVTDETNVGDGSVARFNHFRPRSDAEATASIYWSKGNGASAIRGSIRRRWIAMGAEKSTLGYPTSYEYEVAGGVREDFEKGYIRANTVTGATLEHQPADRTAHLRTDLSGDFNGDGRSDLATVYDYGDNTCALWVFDALPDGGYARPTVRWTSAKGGFSYQRAKWTAGDVNGDGRADIVALYGYADGSNSLWSFLSNTTGTFTPVKGVTTAVGTGAGSFDWAKAKPLAGDFNGDGKADVAMVYDYGNGEAGAHTWTSKGDGFFNAASASWRTPAGNWWIDHATFRVGDMNGDKRDDIVALYGYTAGGVAVFTFLAQPNGGVAAPVKSWNQPAGGAWEYAKIKFTAGDYNGDGRADAALMYDHGDGHASLSTLLAKPDGTVADAVRSWDTPEGNWYGTNAGMPLSGDSDGDGRDDISSLYNYASGASGTFTFKSRPDGGFENGFLSWQTLPGTW